MLCGIGMDGEENQSSAVTPGRRLRLGGIDAAAWPILSRGDEATALAIVLTGKAQLVGRGKVDGHCRSDECLCGKRVVLMDAVGRDRLIQEPERPERGAFVGMGWFAARCRGGTLFRRVCQAKHKS